MSAGPGHILIVEDNETTATSLRLFLESDGYRVSHAATAATALAAVDTAVPDLILLDRMLPDGDGLTICRRLRAVSPVPIVMLTARTSDDDIVEGLEAGADDYVCKPFGAKSLMVRIRRCLERARSPTPATEVLRCHDVVVDVRTRTVSRRDVPIALTRSEFDILALLMRSPGRVFTRAQIIDGALGHAFTGFDRTIDTHVWSLRRKLADRRGDGQLITSEAGVGYRMRDPGET